MNDIVQLTEQTVCHKCGGVLGVGINVRCEFDTDIDGYIHRHKNGCRRAAEHHLIMEAIHGTCNTIDTESGEAEADEGNEDRKTKAKDKPPKTYHRNI